MTDTAATLLHGAWNVRDVGGLRADDGGTTRVKARDADYLTEREMHRAVTVAHDTLATLARARYSLRDWQDAHGLTLAWPARPVVTA